jgi:hypothetical protein
MRGDAVGDIPHPNRTVQMRYFTLKDGRPVGRREDRSRQVQPDLPLIDIECRYEPDMRRAIPSEVLCNQSRDSRIWVCVVKLSLHERARTIPHSYEHNSPLL